MERRHEDRMRAYLERVFALGVAEVNRYEMQILFGQRRIARGVWRQIVAMWGEVVATPADQKLLVGGIDTDNWFFVFGNLVPTNEESYLKDVRWLAGETDAEGNKIEADEDD